MELLHFNNKATQRNKASDYVVYDQGPFFQILPDAKNIQRFSPTGMASKKEVPPRTIPELLNLSAEKHGSHPAMRSEMMPPLKPGETPPPALPLSEWKTWTWAEYRKQARTVGKAMIALGHQPFQSCNVFGFNSPEWSLAMVGVILAGGRVAGIYPTDNADQVQYKSDHSDGSIAVVEDEVALGKYISVADKLPLLKAIITYGCDCGEDITTSDGRVIKTLNWETFMHLGESDKSLEQELDARIAAQDPGHCCALVYTSGTTGRPKAVMISHDGICFASCTVLSGSDIIARQASEERVLSYLPLSHIAGSIIDVFFPLVMTSNISDFNAYASTNFARVYDLKVGTLVERLTTVRPTVFLGVPRVYEKIMEKLLTIAAEGSAVQNMISGFLKKRNLEYLSTRQYGQTPSNPSLLGVANLVMGKIRQKLGLDQVKFMFSGAAPMTKVCLEYFASLGMNIKEVYGMSESSGIITFSSDELYKWGSVGFEVPGVEVKILNEQGEEMPDCESFETTTEANQGEICFRGRNVMIGYMANPRLGQEHVDELMAKNEDTIDKNGFLHSGDKGCKDKDGFVKITGRYKELIIGAGGENIAPVPIEDELKRICPFISNVMMVGNLRKYNVMLVTLKTEGATGELPGTDILLDSAATLVPGVSKLSEAMKNKQYTDIILDALEQVNKNEQVVPSNAATVQKFTILPRDFSVVGGELTATLKLKRSVVDEIFEPIISKMFEVGEKYVPYDAAPSPGIPMPGKAKL